MKERFAGTRFSEESREIIRLAEQICDNYARQGYDLSLRQLYYQFISKDFFPNTEQSYKRLGSIISDARVAGLIDWGMIKDRGRETVGNNHWGSPADVLDACAAQFRYDTWAEQPNHVEVMVEKQALEGVLEPVCRRLDIRFTANKGYSSSSALYETGKRLQAAFVGEGDFDDYAHGDAYRYFACAGDAPGVADFFDTDKEFEPGDLADTAECLWEKWERTDDFKCLDAYEEATKRLMTPFMRPHYEGGKALHILYLGDHDPSGMDMTRDVRERLETFSRCPVEVHRLALNMPQIERYEPPPNPAKMTDSRATDYVRKFGDTSWELDALEPSVLAALVTDMVTGLRDDGIHAAAAARQDAARAALREMAQGVRAREAQTEEGGEEGE